jgi:hypothetical protein
LDDQSFVEYVIGQQERRFNPCLRDKSALPMEKQENVCNGQMARTRPHRRVRSLRETRFLSLITIIHLQTFIVDRERSWQSSNRKYIGSGIFKQRHYARLDSSAPSS